MNCYDKNIECIKEHRDYLYSQMINWDISSQNNKLDEIQSLTTKNGDKAILIKYLSSEYRLNSIYNPMEEAKRWAAQFEFQSMNTVISMFGFGNGIFTRQLLDKMGESDLLFIYEPCADIFFHVLNNYDITDILSTDNIIITIEGINEFEFHNALQTAINITNLKSQVFCNYPQYDNIFTESCINFFKELRDNNSLAKANIDTDIYFGEKIIDNVLKNIKFIENSNSLNELKEYIPKDIPVIVVAAGPSVEDNIEELKRAKGKAVIVAVDRILDYLLDSGVEPDFVVTLDPMKPVKYFSRRTDITIPLMCFMAANNEVLECHKGRKIICNCTPFLEQIYFKAKKLPARILPSGSVATVAFTACVELGFTRIILVGQDLAFNGNQTHAGGAEETRDIDKNIFLEGIDGKPVKSRYDWKVFATWYKDMIKLHPEIEVIDSKEKGAKIEGTLVMPLKEAIDKYCINEYNSNAVMEQKKVTFDTEEIKAIKKYLEENLRILLKIKQKAETAIKACNVLIKENSKNNEGSKLAREAMLKLEKVNRYIESQPIYSIMDMFIAATIAQHLSEIYQFTNDVKKDSLQTYEKSKLIYKAVIDATEFIKPRVEKSVGND